MESIGDDKTVKKDWSLLVTGKEQDLLDNFCLFYDDFYRLGLSWYAHPDLIKESIHNLFLELWRIGPTIPKIVYVKSYIISIYKRIIYKTNKDFQQNEYLDPLSDALENEMDFEMPYETFLIASQTDELQKKKLEKALEQLTTRQKELIFLRFFEGLGFSQIAERTSLTERTVYNTVHNAVKRLRELL
ncbi:RNA polymerase sigma-70 factor, ECF subfamily [bacterium A37T11]|nr:RNA polymerase sigma-70 factor, ECF subfamily [bacterium A37T11]